MSDNNPSPRRVLVTGSTGAIGQPVCRHLDRLGHSVRGFARRPTPGLEDYVVGDLADRGCVMRAVEGMDTVIHLGAYPNDADFLDVLMEPNVRGLFHICDAARQHGVRRLVLASTLQVVSGHKGTTGPVRVEDGPAPTNHYALTKVWAEAAGEMYARAYGLSVISARIGWLPRNPDEARNLARLEAAAVFLSHDDACRFFERCVVSPTPGAGESTIVFATSRPPDEPRLDLESAGEAIGYQPQDTWPEGLPYPLDFLNQK